MKRLQRRHAGLSLIWSIVMILGLCAVASLAVDMGRVQIVKTQLRATADAAALAAAQLVLSDPAAARLAAIDVAALNQADGSKVVLDPNLDVELVVWDADRHGFTPAVGSMQANAVRVTARRIAARGNAVDLPFARILGATTCDVNATAIAMASPMPHAVIGLDYIRMTGNASSGSATRDGRGSMASNGNITIGGSASVDGNAHPGLGRAVIGSNKVNGSTSPLTETLVFPPADSGDAATRNNNSAISSILVNGALVMGGDTQFEAPAGTYCVKGVNLGSGAVLNFTGPATLYVEGSIELNGRSAITIAHAPDLKIIVLGDSTLIDFNGGTLIKASIYAPETRIDMHGESDIYGSLVARSIDITGNTRLHYDMSLRGGAMLVQ